MPTTLLTGSNGFVGSTMIDELLKQDHTVVAAVRSPSSIEVLLSLHPEWDKAKVKSAAVSDFTAPGAFDHVFEDNPELDYIIHCAAPMPGHPGQLDFVEHFERPSILGNLGLLKSAKAYGKNVKAIAITGSINAITTGMQEDVKSRAFDNTQWLPYSREDALNASDNQFLQYCVSKKIAEKAIWKFIEEERPQFTVTNFMPALIWGPMLQKVESAKKVNFSDAIVQSVLNSGKSDSGTVPNTSFPGYIDVRDLAALHIAALTTPAAANKRFVVGHPLKFDMLADAIRAMPEYEDRVGKNNEEVIKLPTIIIKDADDVFGIKWRSLEETARDTAKSIVAVEARG